MHASIALLLSAAMALAGTPAVAFAKEGGVQPEGCGGVDYYVPWDEGVNIPVPQGCLLKPCGHHPRIGYPLEPERKLCSLGYHVKNALGIVQNKPGVSGGRGQ